MSKKPKNGFWRKYLSGRLRSLADVVEARTKQVAEDAVDAALMRIAKPGFGVPSLNISKAARRSEVFFTSDTYLRQMARADWQNVDPRIRKFAGKMLRELRKQNLPFFVIWAFRTPEEQNEAAKNGTSQLTGWRAPHCQGKAVDIVSSVMPYKLSKTEYAQIGRLGYAIAQEMGISVKWGGEFKSIYDPAHWELTDWRDEIIQRPIEKKLILGFNQLEK